MSDKHSAYHEAGHAAADLLLGHDSTGATNLAKDETPGSTRQLDGHYMTAEGMEALMVAHYAGPEAEKRDSLDQNLVKMGASDVDEQAAEFLSLLGSTENDLRERVAKFISERSGLVEQIASELLFHERLHGDELDIMRRIYRGENDKERS